MSETVGTASRPQSERVLADRPGEPAPGQGAASLVYILYLVAAFTGLPYLIGVIIAYVKRGEAAPWTRTHLSRQIRLFWWLVLWGIVGWLLSPILIGFLILGLAWLWNVIASIQGLRQIGRGEPA